MKELCLVLQEYPTIVPVDGHPLINFQRYPKLMDRINEVVHYKPPDLEKHRQLGYLDYLEKRLRSLHMSPIYNDDLMARCRILGTRQAFDFKAPRPQLKVLGSRPR